MTYARTETKREAIIKAIEKEYPMLFLKKSELFDGSKGGLWTSGESHGSPFDYYNTREQVAPKMADILRHFGWIVEWHDPGTVLLYPDNVIEEEAIGHEKMSVKR